MREGLLSGSHEGAELLGSADGDHGNHSTARERRFRGKSPTIAGAWRHTALRLHPMKVTVVYSP